MAAAETPVSAVNSSPDYRERTKSREEEKVWNFAFDSHSESMESCDSDQMIVL